jgi:hypothetical protein
MQMAPISYKKYLEKETVDVAYFWTILLKRFFWLQQQKIVF